MKIEINGKLPKGFKLVNGKVVRTMAQGGNVNKTLAPIPRDKANLEAEKGETALTDLTNDGSFELYNIGGKRHTQGGTPLNLPEQSFVYSDTRSMKLTVEELKSLGIISKKKMTPAEASKKFPLNEYIEIMENENSDKVSIDTAEEMINKNKIKLSQIAFLQESKKDFSDGLPLAAYPFLISKGINPQEMEAKIAEKNGPQQNPSPQMSQEQMAMGPQQGNLQQFTGPPQGGPPMPPQGGMPPMGPPMAKYGTELPSYQKKGERNLIDGAKRQLPSPGNNALNDLLKGYKNKTLPGNKSPWHVQESNWDLNYPGYNIDFEHQIKIHNEKVDKITGRGDGFHTLPYIPMEPHLQEYQIKKDKWLWENPDPNQKGFELLKYGGKPGAGGGVGVCPTCGKNLPCGCKYKMGGDLPKFQGNNKSEVAKTLLGRGKNIINYVNPFTFKLNDNWLISSGNPSGNLETSKYNLGSQNLGLMNLQYPKLGIGDPSVENVKVWGDHQGLGVGNMLYDKSIKDVKDYGYEGLVSGDQSLNAMESPETTVAMWKYFDKQIVQLKPWETDKQELWVDANDIDFTQYLKEVDGVMTYTGPEVRLTGLNEAGKKKVEISQKFFNELQIDGANLGDEGSSDLINWSEETAAGNPVDWHSPIGRWSANGFKTMFGREPRIGSGTKFAEYNKASLYTLLGIGTFAYFNQDKIDDTLEEELYQEWLREEAIKQGIPEDQLEDFIKNPENYDSKKNTGVPNYIEDSIEQGIDIKRLGGQPFKMSSLRKFTGGGDLTHPEDQVYGAAPLGAVQGGTLPTVDIFDDATPSIGPGERMLMDMGEQRRLLLQSYAGIKDRTDKNPNIMEDPEESLKIQYQINQIEEQISAIDQKTSIIEQQLLQERLQLDPFAEDVTQPIARYGGQLSKFVYGGSLPKFQTAGQTYGDWIKETGKAPMEGVPLDAVWNPEGGSNGTGSFQTEEQIERDAEVSENTFSTYEYSCDDGVSADEASCIANNANWTKNWVSKDPYAHTRTTNPRYETDANGDVVYEMGPDGYEIPKANPSYDPELDKPYNEGADKHEDFFQTMQTDDFANVRANWIKKTKELINDKGYLKRLLDKHNGNENHPSYISGKAAYDEMVANIGSDPTKSEEYLFDKFNQINKLFNMAAKTGHGLYDKKKGDPTSGSAANLQKRLDEAADKMGLPRVSRSDMMAYQTMYGALAIQQEQGSDEDKALLKQVNLNFGDATGGHIELKGGNISEFDGFAGDNSSKQFVGVVGNTKVDHEIKEFDVSCKGAEKERQMQACVEKNKAAIEAETGEQWEFNPKNCDCKPLTIPPPIIPPEKPRYETFDQDDLAVAVKSGQFPDLITPTRQATPDPAMVDPMYVDPRQQLSTLEATAAAALRAGADPSLVMGSMQDQSEKVINKHEALNTKIYNNAMNVNVPALQQFTQSKMENEKNYMDEQAMALGTYQTEYKDAEDALLSAEQNQMSNADEMYIRNLENPNYWFSPKRHNIEFYNEKNIDGTQTDGAITYDEAAEWCRKQKITASGDLVKCINMRMGNGSSSKQSPLNTNRASEEVVSLGTEVKGFSKRQADLERSRKKLNKWITGH